MRALAEGAVIGGYDGRRWRSGAPPRGVERFVICGCDETLAPVAERAELVARWTNTARELVDAPANVITPATLTDRVVKFAHLGSEIVDPVRAGLTALAAVGGSSPIPPRLIVLRHSSSDALDGPRLALVGKGVTFDTGGYFLKPQSDIVRQKADMGGGAAVVAALGAIAELGLPLSVTGFVPACENNLRNTSGKSFGFPIVAATFLQQFAGDGPWAHVDMLGPALLDEDRGDAFGAGASGYGVRMLVELATRLSVTLAR